MLKKLTTAGMAAAATLSLVACSDAEDVEVDGTWKSENETIEISEGRFTMTSTEPGDEFTFEGDVDYENQKLNVNLADQLLGLYGELPEEVAGAINSDFAQSEPNSPLHHSIKFTIDGDTLTVRGENYNRED